MSTDIAASLTALADDDVFVNRIHCRIEDELIEMRDARISMLTSANGLVVKERDGSPSSIIRLGTHHAVKAILRACAEEIITQGRVQR